MTTEANFSKILTTLGGIKLNVLASENRSTLNEHRLLEKIELVEKELGGKIPHDYLEFIKETNAISFNQQVKTKAIDKLPIAGKDNQFDIDNFFDFYNDKASIIQVLKTFKSNLPTHALPICEGAAGDLIIIDLSKENYGKIYYWHHEHEDEITGLYLVANNFNQFMTNLFVEEDSETANADDIVITNISSKFLERLKKSGKI